MEYNGFLVWSRRTESMPRIVEERRDRARSLSHPPPVRPPDEQGPRQAGLAQTSSALRSSLRGALPGPVEGGGGRTGCYTGGMSPRTSPRVERSLRRFAVELRRRFASSLRELRLFGSQARGEAGAESDVDVLVVLDAVDWRTRCQILDLAADVGLDEGLVLSPTILDETTWRRWCRQERPLAMDVEREGVRL